MIHTEKLPRFGATYAVECFGQDGRPKWKDTAQNLVTNQGKHRILAKAFLPTILTTSNFHYIGLKGIGAPAVTDTETLRAWSEFIAYSEIDRPLFDVGTQIDGYSANNIGRVAVYSVTAPGDVAGVFLDRQKGKNFVDPGNEVISVADFASLKSVIAGDTIKVTCIFSAV